MLKAVKSIAASRDIDEILDYTSVNFGSAQMTRYFDQLNKCIERLQHNPNQAPAREDLGKGLRVLLCQRHLIVFRLEGQRVLIVRVLHASSDVPKAL